MNDDRIDRRHLTFEQAMGAAPLPSQLQPREISQALRAVMWAHFYDSFEAERNEFDFRSRAEISDPWRGILWRHHVLKLHRFSDDFSSDFQMQAQAVKQIVTREGYLEFFGFIEWVIRDEACPRGFVEGIDTILAGTRAAYRVVNRDTIAPISSEAELATLENAFRLTLVSGFMGSHQHLRAAATAATAGSWATCIRESMHAVESTARSLVSGASELGPALAELEKAKHIHPALKKGFGAIYGFTSDEKGIRHPLLDNAEANVDEADALFMLGACAAFVSYLIGKGRTLGLIGS